MTIGVAVVGCGLIGQKRALALPESTELVAVYDPIAERAAEVAAIAGGNAAIAASLLDAVSADGAELVIVATPHAELAPTASAAISVGRHVLIEKPGAHGLEPLLDVQRRAVEANRLVWVGFNHRFHPAVRKAHEIVGSGRYGPVFGIRARYGHGGRVGYEREWRANRAVSGGGELIDQGMHLIDLSRLFAGDFSLRFSELRTDFWAIDVEDNAYLALANDEGAFAWLHASWTEWKNLFSFEIAMQHAKVEISGLGGSYGTECCTLYEMSAAMGPPVTSSWAWPGVDRSWTDELADITRSLGGVPGFAATVDDAVAAFRIVEAAYRNAP